MNTVKPAQNVLSDTTPLAKCLISRRYSLAKTATGGQVTVELALICIPFFVILFVAIDLGQIFFYENAIQNAMREAARFGTAGRIIQAKGPDGLPLYTNYQGITYPVAIPSNYGSGDASRNECIRYWFLSNCVIAPPLSSITIVSAPTLPGVPAVTALNDYGRLILQSGFTTTTSLDADGNTVITTNSAPAVVGPGGKEDYMQITVHYDIQTITPLSMWMGGWNRRSWSSGFQFTASAIVKNEGSLINFHHTNIYSGEPFDPTWNVRP